MFQPTPRFVSEANSGRIPKTAETEWFQPTPRFVSEANQVQRGVAQSPSGVSTHAPLRQRGEPVTFAPEAEISSFQPTPRFVSEANPVPK